MCGGRTHAIRGGLGYGAETKPFQPKAEGKSAILMGVHMVGLIEVAGGLVITSSSNSIRMDTTDLLELLSGFNSFDPW